MWDIQYVMYVNVCLWFLTGHSRTISYRASLLKAFTAPEKNKKMFLPHQFPINIPCCRMVKTLVIFCLLCAGRCGAEGTAPNKLRSPRWRVGLNSEPYSATSLACIHTGICSIMNPNMTARNWKITTLTGPRGIRSAMTGGSPTAWHHSALVHLQEKCLFDGKESASKPLQMWP